MAEIIDIGATGGYSELAGYGLCDAAGTTVPTDGSLGYSRGCLFHHVDGSGATNSLYLNIGDKSSANFDPLDASALQSALYSTAQRAYPITFDKWRVWDAIHTNLPGTAANDDLGIVSAFSTDGPYLDSGDAAGGIISRLAMCQVAVPPTIAASGQVITVDFVVNQVGEAGTSATIDLNAFLSSNWTADLCATAAQSIVGATSATKSFTIELGGALTANTLLDLFVTLAVNDTSGANGQYIITKSTVNFTTKEWA